MKHEHQDGEHEHQQGHASGQHEPTTGHEQNHTHDLSRTPSRSLALALALTASFLVVEAIMGWLSGSLALLSDAGHMLTDAGALALALAAQRLAVRPRTPENTYGLRRAEILAALLNGLVLGVSSVCIVVEAIERWSKPAEIKGGWVFVVATVGLGMNLLAAWLLSRGEKNTNVKAALAHVLADAAGSVAAMIAGALVYLVGWTRADAVVSVLISLLILWGAWRLLKDSTRVLLEGTPDYIDLATVEKTIRETQGVTDVHDLHLWSISDDFPVLTVHIVLAPQSHGVEVARLVCERVQALGIAHATVQPEAHPRPLLPASALLARKETLHSDK
ncbi:MAG: cation diffusion facilitator family transporter [Polyangiaceae bacterium]|jgi:cobalt-zinc-cadmium efflux system protein|nr:cation diffusion facilitator family transporter [Polyangiaceae bacterium]